MRETVIKFRLVPVLWLWLVSGVYGIAYPVVKDTLIENLLKKVCYKEAVSEIRRRLEGPINLTVDQQLYYYNHLALIELRLRNVDSSMYFARKSLSLITMTRDSMLISEGWKAISYACNNSGKLDTALIYIQLLYKYAERHKDEKQMRNALTSIAAIQSQNKKYQEALILYRKSAGLTIKIGDSTNYGASNFNLGLTFLNLRQFDSSIFYLDKALGYAKHFQLPDQLVYIYGTLADCYLEMNNEKERKKYLLLANQEAERIGNKQFLAMGYSHLASCALRENNYSEVVAYGDKALKLLKEQPYPVLKIKIDSMMCVAYKGKGMYAQALGYLESFNNEQEKFRSIREEEMLQQLTMSLKVKEKDLTIANQQLEITGKKRKIEVLSLVLILIAMLVIGLSVYILQKREFHRQLYGKEKELDKLQADIQNWLTWKEEQTTLSDKQGENQVLPSEKMLKQDSGTAQLALFNELRDIFTTDKLYLDPELNLKMVVKLLGTNKKYLNQALSGNTDANFRSFINRYRIDEAKKIMETFVREGKEVNLADLPGLSGFNSVVSFYRAFNAVTGLTPKNYLREIIMSERKKIK